MCDDSTSETKVTIFVCGTNFGYTWEANLKNFLDENPLKTTNSSWKFKTTFFAGKWRPRKIIEKPKSRADNQIHQMRSWVTQRAHKSTIFSSKRNSSSSSAGSTIWTFPSEFWRNSQNFVAFFDGVFDFRTIFRNKF